MAIKAEITDIPCENCQSRPICKYEELVRLDDILAILNREVFQQSPLQIKVPIIIYCEEQRQRFSDNEGSMA